MGFSISMKFDNLINLELTQKSGQTSQPPWIEMYGKYCDLIYLSEVPILINAYQDDITSLNVNYELPIDIEYLKDSIDEKSIEKNIKNEINRIFDLNFDLNRFYDYLSEDSKLKPTVDFSRGLRLFLAKNPFEAIVSSIASANNSIVRWTKSIANIRKKWGNPVKFSSGIFYEFPCPELLQFVHENDLEEFDSFNGSIDMEFCIKNLKSCGVGYRASYIKKTSEILSNDINLLEIFDMDYEEAFETVLTFPGVGPKVADCILLYGYGFKEAFPTDIWIKRIISYLYFDNKDISVSKIQEFGMEHFGEYAGYVQLYLFHYARKSGLMNKLK